MTIFDDGIFLFNAALTIKKQLNFKEIDEKGDCVHYVEKGIDACLIGQYYSHFRKRNQFIQAHYEQYHTFFSNVKEERKAKALLNGEERKQYTAYEAELFDIAAFLEQGDMYQNPAIYTEIFGRPLTQMDTEEISYFAQSIALAKAGGRSSLAKFTGIYQQNELTDFVNLFYQLALQTRHNFAFSLTSIEPLHRMGFAFDSTTKEFICLERHLPYAADGIEIKEEHRTQRCEVLAELIYIVFTMISKSSGNLVLHTEISALTSDKPSLQPLVDDILISPNFQNLHELNLERLNRTTSNGNSWAHLAACFKDTKVLRYIVKNELFHQLNLCTNVQKCSPLHYSYIQPDSLKILMSAQLPNGSFALDFNQQDDSGETIAFKAASHNYLETLDLLINLHSSNNIPAVDLNIATQEGDTPLAIAISHGHLDAVKLLINAKNRDDGSLRISFTTLEPNLLMKAIEHEWLDIVQFLIDAKIDNKPAIDLKQTDKQGIGTAIYIAAQQGNLEILNILLNAKNNDGSLRVDLNSALSNGCTPAYVAAFHNRVAILKRLIEEKNLDGSTLIDFDRGNGDVAVTPIYICAQKGFIEAVTLLINAGVNINKPTVSGDTPILAAIATGNIEIFYSLLKPKSPEGNLIVNLHHANNNGVTPILLAVEMGNVEITRILLSLKTPTGESVTDLEKNNLAEKLVNLANNNHKMMELFDEFEVIKNDVTNILIANA